MKFVLFSVILLLLVNACKSEEQKPVTTPKQGDTYVLPPTKEQPKTIEKQANIDPRVTEEILTLINENLAATQSEDKKAVLSTIHKDSPQRNSTIQGMDFVFQNYDMVYKLEKAEVIEVTDEEVKVYYMQTTMAKKGVGFQPARTTGIHILKKENGKWKIFKTEYLTNEPLM